MGTQNENVETLGTVRWIGEMVAVGVMMLAMLVSSAMTLPAAIPALFASIHIAEQFAMFGVVGQVVVFVVAMWAITKPCRWGLKQR